MPGLLDGIKVDVAFVKSHQLQPSWFKVLKVLIVVGLVAGYGLLLSWRKAGVFLIVFLLLSLIVHLIYRRNTQRWTQRWQDFDVVEVNGVPTPRKIGKIYYAAVIVNAVLALILSMMLA